MNIKTQLESQLGAGRIKKDESLYRYSTLRVGGPAEYFFAAQTNEELIKAIKVAKSLNLKVTVLGGGSNVLIADKGIKGLVIRNEAHNIRIIKRIGKINKGKSSIIEALVEADSGVLMNQLVRFCCDEGLGGLERHLGLPGTVGGALYTNSKWTKPMVSVGDKLYCADILTLDNQIKTVKADYFQFGYDYSKLQVTHETVIKAVFRLLGEEKQILWQRAQESVEYRKKTQPMGVSTAGCTFRNISVSDAMRIGTPKHTVSTGYLIDSVGLKSYSINGAKFSDHHANFIINTKDAQAADIFALINEAKKRIKNKYGIDLELEIIALGDFN